MSTLHALRMHVCITVKKANSMTMNPCTYTRWFGICHFVYSSLIAKAQFLGICPHTYMCTHITHREPALLKLASLCWEQRVPLFIGELCEDGAAACTHTCVVDVRLHAWLAARGVLIIFHAKFHVRRVSTLPCGISPPTTYIQ
jgi:hypothetical protein